MKRNWTLFSGILLLSCASIAQAQIVFQDPVTITGSVSQLSTLGSYVDAVGANGFSDGNLSNPGAAITIGDTTFNPIFSDSGIVLSSSTGISGGTNGSGSISTPFLTVLDDVAFVGNFSTTFETGTVTLNNLTVGDIYQVQVFNDGGALTTITGLNTQAIAQQYTIGTFTADGLGVTTSESFTFSTTNGNGVGELSAISLRDITSIPEPSTYLLLGLGLVSCAVLARIRRLAA
jgi:hypothetical protein